MPREGGPYHLLTVTYLVALYELETHDVLQLPKAYRARFQRPQQDFIQAEGSLHDALKPTAVPQADQMTDLVARDLS